VFERLAHHLQCRSFELRQLIQKEDTVVGEAYFARIWKRATTEQTNVANGMMRIAKRSCGNEGLFGVEQAGDAMDLRCLDCLLERERRNDGWDAFGQHRLTRPRRTDHQGVVTTGNCHLDRALCVTLSFHVAEIDVVILVRSEESA